MTTLRNSLDRPLPTFQKWLEDRGHSGLAGGYEGFAPFVELMRREEARELTGLSEDELSFVRIWQGLGIAVTELCEIERKAGRSIHQVIQTMPRALGVCAMNVIASPLTEDAPFRKIVPILVEEFKHGAKLTADTLSEQYDREQG